MVFTDGKMMSDHKLIIIGFADALSAPEVTFSLLNSGFRVVAFMRQNSKTSALRMYKNVRLIKVTAPEEDAKKTVTELTALYKSLQASAIMPLNDTAVCLCDKLSGDQEILVAGAIGKHAQCALDKRVQIIAARRAGFNVPETINIESIRDAERVRNFPVIMKPALAVIEDNYQFIENKKKFLYYCANKRELNQAMKSWNMNYPLLAQNVHYGISEGLFGIGTGSSIVSLSAHQRIRMMNPKGSGSSACKAMPLIDYPIKKTEDMLVAMNWRGLFMIEFICDKDGKHWFIELNGRPWGSMALARRMGFEYPAWAIMQTLDPSFRPTTPEPRKYVTCRHLGRELIHILYVLRGPSNRSLPNWPPIWETLINTIKISKNDYWYNLAPGKTALFLLDAYETIMNETFRKLIKS